LSINLWTIRKALKYLTYFLGIILILFMLLWLFLQTNYGQNKVLPLALDAISNALGTKVTANRIDVSFFDKIQLDDVLVLDHNADTLIYLQKLDADIGIFSLRSQTISIDKLELSATKVKLSVDKNGTSNYNHILKHLSSNKETSSTTESSSWNFNLDNIQLKNTNLDYKTPDNNMLLEVPNLQGHLKTFSIEDALYHFDMLAVDDIAFSYNDSTKKIIKNPTEVTSFPVLPFTLVVDKLVINSKGINYNKGTSASAKDEFDPAHIAIANLSLKAKNLFWHDSIALALTKFSTTLSDGFQIENIAGDLTLSNHQFDVKNLAIETKNSNLRLDLRQRFANFDTLIKKPLSGNSLVTFQKSNISEQDVSYFFANQIGNTLNLSKLKDLNLEGQVAINRNELDLQKLKVQIGSKFTFNGQVRISDVTKIEKSKITFDLKKLKTSQSYLQGLIPAIVFPQELKDLGQIEGRMKGYAHKNNWVFSDLNIVSSQGTKVSGRGSVGNLTSAKGPEIAFSSLQLQTNLNELFTDKMTLPKSLQTLEDITYSGALKGNLFDILADGTFTSALGKIDIDAKLNFNSDYSDASYQGYFKSYDFNLGKMLGDTTIGVINFTGNLDGRGLSIDSIQASIDGVISSVYYQGVPYQNITLNGIYSPNLFEGTIVSEDEKLDMVLDGKIDLRGEKVLTSATIDLKNFDLNLIGLADSMFVVGGRFIGTFTGNHIDELVGEGRIEDFSLTTQKGSYSTRENIIVKAEDKSPSEKAFFINSPFLESEIEGRIKPSTLVRFVKNYIKAYIPLELGYDEFDEENLDQYFAENEDQNFVFKAKTKDINPALKPFFGDNLALKSTKLNASFSSKDARLDIKGKIDSLSYRDFLLRRGSYFLDGRKSFINGNLILTDISQDGEILIPQTILNGTLNNKIADFNMVVANENDIERVNLSGALTRTDEYIITFKESIFLNGNEWNFSPYNQVIFGDYGLFLQDLKISKDNQAITIYTDENKNGEAIEILFDKFTFSELTAIIDKKNDFFKGNIQGSLVINSLYENPFTTANLDFTNIMIDGRQAGNLTITAEQDIANNTVKSSLLLFGIENNAKLDFIYGIDDQSTTGTLNLERLNMKVVDPYLSKIFVNSEGYLAGNLNITGSLTQPTVKGKLQTHGIKTTPVFTNSRYALTDTEIQFSNNEIDFGTIELKDKNNNSAFVTGKINHRSLRKSRMDLQVYTDNFEFLNTTANENELFYGNVNVRGNVSLTGPIDDLSLSGSVKAVNASKLTVSPLSVEQGIMTDDFVIYSGDPRKTPTDSLQLNLPLEKVVLPFTIDVKIIVENDSKFSMILNPLTGDRIDCNGNANLLLKLDKSAQMQLFGAYTVSQGVYAFSYGLLKKDFIIQPQSTVSFNGDPLEGDLNVDAIYVANTSVYDLIKFESQGLSDVQKIEAQRKRDLNIHLNLTNKIKSPEIQLEIRQKEDALQSSISDILDSKLNQLKEEPDELNKQVFGLLLFGNFILARNAETDLTKTGTDLAISSVSDLVSQQLNKLADGQIGGFNVNFDVDSYSSQFLSGGQEGVITEFGLGVEKNLLDDRLSISVGTNLNLESSAELVDFNTIAGDFILVYKVNEDGSFRLKAYRRSTFDRLTAEGNTAINGVGIYVRKEFGEIKRKKE